MEDFAKQSSTLVLVRMSIIRDGLVVRNRSRGGGAVQVAAAAADGE